MKVYWLVLLFVAFSILSAQLPPQLAEMPLATDPDILHGTLENGLKYYIVENAKPANRVELRLWVDAGSVLEDDDQLGLAHFTEHMAFNGTKNFAKSEVVDYLASIGMGFANGLNAMTSFDFTMYQLKVPTDNPEHLQKGFQILSDMAYQVTFDPDELERERGVIIEEWRMGQDANSRIRDITNKVTFAGSRYADRMPIGTYESLTTFGRDEIVRFYHDWYRPDLQTVLVIGDMPKAEALRLIEQYFAVIPARENPRPREIFSVPDHPEPRAVVATDPEFSYSTISASWTSEHTRNQTVGDFFQNLHQQMFFTMLNARLQELTQDEDPPFSFAYGSSGTMLKGLAQTNLTAYTGEGKNLSALNVLMTEAERVRQHGFVPGEFERAKINYIRRLEAAVEQKSTQESSSLVWQFFGTMMRGDVRMSPEHTLMLAQQLLDGVQLANINALVDDLITEDNLTISYASFDKDGMIHPTEAELLGVYALVNAAQISPYEDTEVTEPLMEAIPKAGRITKRKVHKDSGIREWTLSNGVTVISKKTAFKADEVLFGARRPGGFSGHPISEAHNAQLLGSFLDGSGVGDFDNNTLTRMLAGKIARVNMGLETYYDTFNGSASPRDLETLFQLIYQNATNARFEQKSLAAFIGRMKPWLENAENNPESVFSDSLQTLLYAGHPMYAPLRVGHLNRMRIENLQSLYQQRFGDYTGFTFFFVGNFDEAILEEYCKIYLANLPAKGKKTRITDAGIRPFSGRQEVRFAKGSSESAYVAHATTDAFNLSDDNKVAMSAMINVLNEKLRENIRERMSGVYAIQAWPQYIDHPKSQFMVTIWMSCSPERVDELNSAIFATIDSIRAGTFDERYIVSSKAVLEKRYEESIAQNRYWLSRMTENKFSPVKLDSFLDHPARYARIDRKMITKAAQDYLKFDKSKLTVVMVPDKSAVPANE